ncbi:helix-turn-helix domain-containing protein [Mucilaginibacter sp. RCC_168]|uniref:helix-turn-helix domain-containing protein n=1 Tax=Mucilaginibacter sp. RCC_168 TaxID=3239221 RepID=UPI0035254835
MNSTGEKIRLKRLEKRLSQENMAFELDISQAAYSKIELGQTELTINRIFEIAEILEVSPYIFMPKPKYGTALAQEYVYKTLNKLRKFWQANRRKKSSLNQDNESHTSLQ